MSPMQQVPDYVIGRQRDGIFHDAVGRPIQVGDIITYATARSSNLYQNFGRILKFKPTGKPMFIGWAPRRDAESAPPRMMSWFYAYELRVEYMEYDHFYEVMKRKDVYEAGVGYRPARDSDPVKSNTIKRVDRVIRLDLDTEPEFGRHDDGSPRQSKNAWKPSDSYDPLG